MICPKCSHQYEDWYRASINLELDDFDDEYLDRASSSICPKCNYKVSHNVLIVRRDGVWDLDQRRSKVQPPQNAVLIRIGIDHSYGGWNAPADPKSREFVFVPIPENNTKLKFHDNGGRFYDEVIPSLRSFVSRFEYDLEQDLRFPGEQLLKGPMHLDPDFEQLTYGNKASKNSMLRKLVEGDLLVFYAGMKSMRRQDKRLIYGIIGLMVVDEILDVEGIPHERWNQNAHTRKVKRGKDDIVIWGKPGLSGLLTKYIPIGDFRDRAYRVKSSLLKTWGDLSVKNGYIQRSAVPPTFLNPKRFYKWFLKQEIPLTESDFWEKKTDKVIIVQLRKPKNDPSERRDDPFYEFGSFGCTGCHSKNLMNPLRIHELKGVRIAFAQGGNLGTKLVLLTPPIKVKRHTSVCELLWGRGHKPFRYDSAPLLIDNDGETDFPGLMPVIRSVDRTTWMGRFASRFRTSRTPLSEAVAGSLIHEYERRRQGAEKADFAKSYVDTMPFRPPHVETQRRKRYRMLLAKNGAKKRSGSRC